MYIFVLGPSRVKCLTRKCFYDMTREYPDDDINKKLDNAEASLLGSQNYSEDQRKEVKKKLSYLKSEIKRRWIASHYVEHLFLKRNDSWLQGTFVIPQARSRPGRPQKSFGDVCERTKRRKTEAVRSKMNSEELTFATHVKLQCEGKTDAANVIKDLTQSPSRAKNYRNALIRSQNEQKLQLTALKALSMFVEAGLSRRQYETIRSFNKNNYPCYTILQNAKKDCYPVEESYRVSETCAEINLQDVLNHTAQRLFLSLTEVLQNLQLHGEEDNKFILVCKWGCDGSQQTKFKQKFENSSDSDANIFQSSFVPLQLSFGQQNKIVWRNPVPSSPRYCRPIRIRFIKESVDTTNEEIGYIENKINSLEDTHITHINKTFSVKHVMTLTMVDAKVCNAATLTKSTMKCYICGATSKDFNNLSLSKPINEESLKYGLSILHARIRLFEALLHIAYKLPVKKWQLRTENDKQIVQQKKLEIQEAFRTQLGLIVDVPKAGFGNSNDGNTSRRFFKDHELSATILGIDSVLVYRLKVILEAISSGHKIDTEKFGSFCWDTAKLYVELYPWHPMTPTLHKILMHGSIVIEKALLPIGMMSEEAAEARNKHFRSYRQDYARKFSREACNRDIINRLLLSSDPVITGMRPTPPKTTKPFQKDTLEMLLPAEVESQEDLFDDEDLVKESTEESWLSSSD